MKKNIFFLVLCFSSTMIIAQNTGIGTTTPSEKLDVNGSINLAKQLKINGDSGRVNQVLMKNSSNGLIWGDMTEFKYMAVFDCDNIATSPGTLNCSDAWTVPAGVTSILVECWGGGGGGGYVTGGAGGGYISARVTVTPGALATLTIAAGGRYVSGVAVGVQGGTTNFSIAGVSMNAFGGGGSANVNILTTPNFGISLPAGGSFGSAGLSNQVYGLTGMSGTASKTSFTQSSSTEWDRIIQFGDGGDGANSPGSGGKGGHLLVGTSFNQNTIASSYAPLPGGGGAADNTSGESGHGGRIIIHY